MPKIEVVNIKCGGCGKSIVAGLEKAGLSDIKVDVDKQEVSFEGDQEQAKKTLLSLGYPEKNSPEAKSFSKKARSFVSCFIGKNKKNKE